MKKFCDPQFFHGPPIRKKMIAPLMSFTASFSSGPQLYESWHDFPIDLLYKHDKDMSSLDTKWLDGQKFEDLPCPNSQYRDSKNPGVESLCQGTLKITLSIGSML